MGWWRHGWMIRTPHDVCKSGSKAPKPDDFLGRIQNLGVLCAVRMPFTSSSTLCSKIILQAYTRSRGQIRSVRLLKQCLERFLPYKRLRAVSTIFRTSRTSRGIWKMGPSKWPTLTRGARALQTARTKSTSVSTDNQRGLTSIDE